VWTQLILWFPNAICHEVKRDTPNQELRCDECEKEEIDDGLLADKLRDWYKAATSSPVLQGIARRKCTANELTEKILNQDTDDGTFSKDSANELYLVHRRDVDAWRTALKAVNKHTGKSTSELTELLIETVFSCVKRRADRISFESLETCKGMDRNLDVMGHMYSSMCSLNCVDHGFPLERAVLKSGVDPKDMCISLVNSFVEPLTPAEYVAFIGSVYDLGILLSTLETEQEEAEPEEETRRTLSSSCVTTTMIMNLSQRYHPRVQFPIETLVSGSSSLAPDAAIDIDHILKRHYSGGICRDEDCNGEFDKENKEYEYLETTERGKTNLVDLYSEACDDANQNAACTTSDNSTFPLRAFQVEPGAELDSVVSSISGLPPSESTAATKAAYGQLRRSARKRKTTYPSGSILREDTLEIHSHHNIAAVRLFLYEKCSGFPLDRDLTLIIPRSCGNHVDMTKEEKAKDTCTPPPLYVALELPYEWNEKSLEDIVAGAVEGKEDLVPNSSLKSHIRSEIFLCWSNGKKGAKKSEEDTPVPHETLIEGLLELTNVESSTADDTPTGEKKKSTRRAERGFRGTLLHSAAPNSDESKKSEDTDENKKSEDADDSKNLNDADEGKKSDDARESSEDEKENQVHNVNVPKEKKSDKVVAAKAQAASDPDVVVLDGPDEELLAYKVAMKEQSDESLSVLVQSGRSDAGPRHLRSSILDPKEEALVKKLVSCVSDESIALDSLFHSKCREAARWAISRNPEHATVDELTDMALAKFYEAQFG